MITELKNVLLDDFWIMPQTPKYTGSGIPYVTSKNIKGGKINFENVNYISIDDYKKISKNRPILKNDILISMIGTLGETAIVDDSYGEFYGQNMFLVRLDNSKIDYRYFINFFKSTHVKNHLARKQNKSTQSYLKANHIESLMIPVFTIKEQKEIANQLDKVQDLIKLKTQQIKKLDELIKSQFVEMFEDDTYSRVKLGEEFDVSSGGTPSKTKVEYWNSNDISWIGSNMCQNKIIYENDGKYISKSGLEHSSAKVYPVDTVLVALVGATIGKTALLKFETATNQNIAGIQVSERFNAEYVYFAIQNLYYKFTELGKGTFKMANLSFVRDLEIPMPPIELQNKFADFVKQIDKQKFEIQKSLDEIQELYESLMDKYFG